MLKKHTFDLLLSYRNYTRSDVNLPGRNAHFSPVNLHWEWYCIILSLYFGQEPSKQSSIL